MNGLSVHGFSYVDLDSKIIVSAGNVPDQRDCG